MLRSLFSGISGLRAHQQMMDVTGNNIANVNTVGFKTSQASFQDTLSQMVQAAGAPQGGNGGTNPAQVGLGVRLAGINTNFTQGPAQVTGRSTDLMIQGDGFFVVRDGGEQLFSRAGAFDFDGSGRMTTSGGAVVQGWTADPNGVINTNSAAGDIGLPIGALLQPKATTQARFGGNVPSDAAVGAKITTSMTVYDALGAESSLTVTLDKTTATDWALSVNGAPTGTTATFDPTTGKLTAGGSTVVGGITVDVSGLTSYAGSSTVNPLSQNGAAMGSLEGFSISQDGTLVGVFSNGLKQPLAQIAMANFANPPGLEKVGGSMFRTTVNSGEIQLGTAGTGGRGMLQSNMLEGSNVDLAQEFTNLVIAQRGFQANSRVITTSDELLQELVNLKR
jgi:flagellar hook protein FlgE